MIYIPESLAREEIQKKKSLEADARKAKHRDEMAAIIKTLSLRVKEIGDEESAGNVGRMVEAMLNAKWIFHLQSSFTIPEIGEIIGKVLLGHADFEIKT